MSLAASTSGGLGHKARSAARSSRHRQVCRPVQATLWTPGQERPKGYDRPWVQANGGQPILAPRTAEMAGETSAQHQIGLDGQLHCIRYLAPPSSAAHWAQASFLDCRLH